MEKYQARKVAGSNCSTVRGRTLQVTAARYNEFAFGVNKNEVGPPIQLSWSYALYKPKDLLNDEQIYEEFIKLVGNLAV